MNYYETEQKKILREVEQELLAIVTVDLETERYEVIYTDEKYRHFKNRYCGRHFFEVWKSVGLSLIYEPDREQMQREISADFLRARMQEADAWSTRCRFFVQGRPAWCRVRVTKNTIEPTAVVIGIRNVDADYQREMDHEAAMDRLRILAGLQEKDIYIQTFGRFTVFHRGVPVAIRGKAKEILALVVTRRGKEIGNEEIYRTIWENRAYSNANMTVYYNALRRLKHALAQASLEKLLISTPHGQLVNTDLFDCDYYEWLDGIERVGEGCDDTMQTNIASNSDCAVHGQGTGRPGDNGNNAERQNNTERQNGNPAHRFEGEFLSEYSWGEYILGGMINKLIEL